MLLCRTVNTIVHECLRVHVRSRAYLFDDIRPLLLLNIVCKLEIKLRTLENIEQGGNEHGYFMPS